MRSGLRFACLFALVALSPDAAAQYLNRALWLGDELESVRRDYPQGADYFIDRASYVDVPPWWSTTLDPFTDRLFVAGGSVSSDRLTLEAVGNVGVDMGSEAIARLNYLQSENQTTQFQRAGIGIDWRASAASTLFFQLEGTPEKDRADLTLGTELFRNAHGAQRIAFTLVDFSWRKSDEFEYTTPPFGVMFSGFLGDPERVQVAYELGAQLPFEEQELADGDTFRMHRIIGDLELRWRFAPREALVLALGGEDTAKQQRPSDPAAPEREDYDDELGRLRAEWWHSGEGGREYTLGASWLHAATDGMRPNAPAEDLIVRRDELMLIARGGFPLGESWRIEPYLIGGEIDYEQRDGLTGLDSDFDGFQGKFGLPILHRFSDFAWLRIDLSFELDQFAFGGGGVQLSALF